VAGVGREDPAVIEDDAFRPSNADKAEITNDRFVMALNIFFRQKRTAEWYYTFAWTVPQHLTHDVSCTRWRVFKAKEIGESRAVACPGGA